MSTLDFPSRLARPMTPQERDVATQVAVRLRSELARLIATLPEHARGASGMSRHIGVLRATCQRVVQAVQDSEPSPQMLTRLPGVDGLRQFVEGVVKVGASPQDRSAALAGIEAFERLITAAGGSHSKLVERIMMPGSVDEGGPGMATLEQRRELFASGAAVTGRRCRVSLSIYAFRPKPGDPATLERVLGKGLIGSVASPGGMPFVLSSGNTMTEGPSGPTTLDRGVEIRERAPEAILRSFTSDPLPAITSRGSAGNVFQVIDARGGTGEPFDIVTALRASAPMLDPQSGKPTLNSVWSLVSCPGERLVLDVYLHHSIERQYRPGLECLLWTADLDIPPERRWSMRVPNPPRLQLLGHGVHQARTEAYSRHAELSGYLFEHVGWNAEEFIGFRCEVAYPVWRAGYCMTFDPPMAAGEATSASD